MLSKLKKILLLTPFLILIISSIFGFIFLSNTTTKIESITFPSELPDIAPGDVSITSANLYYPANYIPGNKYPVVIIFHGFQVTKETDVRLALELSKRGIFVMPVDIAGHGQTQEILGPYFWKCGVGALDYVYKRTDLFNTSCVGMMGHSMGGWTTFLTMGYEAKRQNRINASVTWAGIFNTTMLIEDGILTNSYSYELRNIKVDTSIFTNNTYLLDHNPATYYTNSSFGAQPSPHSLYGPRIFIVQGDQDTTVVPDQAINANNTLGDNCTLQIYPGADHLLVDRNDVIVDTIKYFELFFFGTPIGNSNVSVQNFTFLAIYLSYFLGLVGFFFSILSGTFLIWFKFKGSQEIPREFIPKGWKFVSLAIIPYIGFLFVFWGIQYILANVIQSLLISSTLIGVYSIFLFYLTSHKRIPKSGYNKLITPEYENFSVLSGFHLGIIATLGYWILSNSYSIMIFKPWNFFYFVYALLYLIPIVFFNEFFWRKIIQDNIPINNRWWRRLLMLIPILITGILLIVFCGVTFLAIIAFLITFLATTISNIFIYSKFRNIRSVLLFTIIPVAFIAGNCYFFFI